jgi:gas vesicle protein
MRGRFVNGILLGGLVGVLAAIYYSPRMKPVPKRYLIGQTRRLGQRTGRMVSDVARDVQDFIRR